MKNHKNHNTHNTNNYDLVIIGGGISGIYTLYKLSKTFPQLKILLLESGERYGGRIYSYKETNKIIMINLNNFYYLKLL